MKRNKIKCFISYIKKKITERISKLKKNDLNIFINNGKSDYMSV